MKTLNFLTENYIIMVDGKNLSFARNKEKSEVEVYFKGMTPDGIKEETRIITMHHGIWLVRPIWAENKLEYYLERVQ